jgi:hypothetical protein
MPDEIDYEAELSLILSEMEAAEDLYELQRRLIQALNAMRAEGLPIPDDLARLEQRMAEDLSAIGGGPAKGDVG